MKRWAKNALWLGSLSLGILVACGGKDEATSGDGDGDTASGGSGDGDTGDGDATGGMGTGGNMTVEMTGSSCEVVDDCYPRVDHEDLSGPAVCLDKVEDGYCSHECEVDMDCCAAEGECESDLEQVCAPFTNLDLMLCFLSCEDDIIDGSTYESADDFCAEEANPDFICRSTGGGGQNKRVCMPGGTQGMGGMGGGMNMGGGGGLSPL